MIEGTNILAALAALTLEPNTDPGNSTVPMPTFTADEITSLMLDHRDYCTYVSDVLDALREMKSEQLVDYSGEYVKSAGGDDRDQWPREDGQWSITARGLFKVFCR